MVKTVPVSGFYQTLTFTPPTTAVVGELIIKLELDEVSSVFKSNFVRVRVRVTKVRVKVGQGLS